MVLATEAQNNFGRVLGKVAEEGVVYITKYDRPQAVVLSVDRYEALVGESNPELADLANKLGVGLVATNDVHFLNKEDHFAHDVLCCISMGRLRSEENRLIYPKELYLKSPAEMQEAVGNFREAIEATVAWYRDNPGWWKPLRDLTS